MAISNYLKTLLTRAASALVAVGLLSAILIYAGVDGILPLVSLAVLLGAIELSVILFAAEQGIHRRLLFIFFTVVVFAMCTWQANNAILVLAVMLGLAINLLMLRGRDHLEINELIQLAAKILGGVFYIGVLPSFVARLSFVEHGFNWFIGLLAIVFAGDTVAYLVGSKLGKHKIAPNYSPNKSWEGAFGGILASLFASEALGYWVKPEFNLISPIFFLFLGLGLCVSFYAQGGDFFESILKRVAGVKDSGGIMPGHGGVLDRIDGVLFAAPVMFFFVTYLI